MFLEIINSFLGSAFWDSLYTQIGLAVLLVLFLIFFWIKWSPLRALIAAIVNGIYGVMLLLSINSETAGLTIILTVGLALTIFGIWGIILWTKLTIKNYQDRSTQSEALEGWWQTVRTFDIILVIGIIFRLFILQPFIVEGPSMEPNFRDREAIMVDKISFQLRAPSRGEVVIFKAPPQPESDYIKRIIGLPGETVTIDRGKVYINGKQLDETYLSSGNIIPSDFPYFQEKLEPDEFFVMGDNRPHSSDSREWGALPRDFLIGRAVLAVYPVDLFGVIPVPKLNL